MKCPICKTPVELKGPYMPFCSDRCRLIDLGKWSDEEYRIPVMSERDVQVKAREDDDGEDGE